MSKNPKLYSVAFKPDHFSVMVMKPTERRLLDTELLAAQIEHGGGATHTLMVDGRVLAVIGFVLKTIPGSVIVFVVPSVYVKDYPVQFFRHVKRMFRTVELIQPLHRMESMAEDTPEMDKWMLRLGFTLSLIHI